MQLVLILFVHLQTEKFNKYQQEINDYRRIRLRP